MPVGLGHSGVQPEFEFCLNTKPVGVPAGPWERAWGAALGSLAPQCGLGPTGHVVGGCVQCHFVNVSLPVISPVF